jgi:two-component system alkaline phosphatase synthesis response regulator PhoP
MKGEEIENVNDAFLRLINFEGKIFGKKDFRQTFCISVNDGNEKSFKRFLSAATDECKLRKIRCCTNPEKFFDISFYRGRNDHKSTVFAEVVPSVFLLQRVNLKNENNINNYTGADFKQNPFKLTDREQQILQLSAKGLALKQIASQLGLSQRTVEKHRANIMHKTQTSSIIETMAKLEMRW